MPSNCPRCATVVLANSHFCAACGFPLIDIESGRAYRDPLIGVIVGERYRLLARIGVGGMGSVYKAEHTHMGKIVAVKLLHGDLSRDQGMIRRFTREARAVSQLHSPNTVSVFDYGQSDGLVYLVMEYLQGSDLGQVLRVKGRLELEQSVRIVQQVAASLTEAHSLGIVHRDLKPENIFLTTDANGTEVVKVLDFGLAKLRKTRGESVVNTERGELVGTPYYMSPEQISGEEVGAPSDVYSLGAMVFKMLSGHPPYDHDNPVAILSKHLTAPVPSLSIPKLGAVNSVLGRALAKTPQARFGTVQGLADALTRTLEDPNVLTTTELPALKVVRIDEEAISTREDFDRFELRLKSRRWLTVSLTTLLFVGAVAGLWFGVLNPPAEPATEETEPNQRAEDADMLTEGVALTGYIGVAPLGERADEDLFRFDNPGTGAMVATITLTGVPGLDLVLKVYTSASREAVFIANANSEGDGELVANLWVNDPHLLLLVREYWVVDRPPSHNTETPYTLAITTREALENEEREPNDETTEALQMRIGDTYRGLIGSPGDMDIYRAPELSEAGNLVSARVRSADPNVDLRVCLYNATGVALSCHDRAPAGAPESLRIFAAPQGHGTLFLGVGAAQPEAVYSEVDSHYVLEVEVTTLPAFTLPDL